uniref:Uncharacterized protein n=1 Tax=Timema tahoe TaxID=61484 RepID=A0A7R9II83_9NEOP|nr:unnamed protein product [Timema tahoe]
MYTSLIQRAVAAAGNGRVSLDNTQIDLAGSYLLNLNNRYVDDINSFQVFGEATQFVDVTSHNPVILINFQYPQLTVHNNFTLTSQDGENIANGQIIVVVMNYTFQFELYTKIRNDGVLDSDLVQLSIQNTGYLTQNVVVEEGEVEEDINESILAAVSNDYNTNTAADIENGITNFAEYAYQDVDLTNYFRYHLLENTVIDIKSYSRDLLEDRRRFIMNDFNGVVRLNDIRRDITTLLPAASLALIADSVFVTGDDVSEEVRQLIKRLLKENYRNDFGDADTMAFWFNNYIYTRPRDGNVTQRGSIGCQANLSTLSIAFLNTNRLIVSSPHCKTTYVHPTEIRTSISPSSAVELNMTGALANYATENIVTYELSSPPPLSGARAVVCRGSECSFVSRRQSGAKPGVGWLVQHWDTDSRHSYDRLLGLSKHTSIPLV